MIKPARVSIRLIVDFSMLTTPSGLSKERELKAPALSLNMCSASFICFKLRCGMEL